MRLSTESKQTDYLNFLLGQYIATGVNDPKNYPKLPYLTKDKDESKHIATTDSQRLAMVRIKYGKK